MHTDSMATTRKGGSHSNAPTHSVFRSTPASQPRHQTHHEWRSYHRMHKTKAPMLSSQRGLCATVVRARTWLATAPTARPCQCASAPRLSSPVNSAGSLKLTAELAQSAAAIDVEFIHYRVQYSSSETGHTREGARSLHLLATCACYVSYCRRL